MASERLNFGRYNGRRLCDIGTRYLAWVLITRRRLDNWLRRCIEKELLGRVDGSPDPMTTRALRASFRPGNRQWHKSMTPKRVAEETAS